jgi:hypothetical protein
LLNHHARGVLAFDRGDFDKAMAHFFGAALAPQLPPAGARTR